MHKRIVHKENILLARSIEKEQNKQEINSNKNAINGAKALKNAG